MVDRKVTLATALLLCLLASCSPKTVYVPVESIRTDTLYRADVRVDSVFLRDSIAVVQRGDTVLVTKYRDRYRYRNRTDTVYRTLTDSVKAAVPCPVERRLTRWERSKMELGGWAFGGIVVLAVAVVWLVFIKRRR